jgi:hypothetical protein
MFYILLLLSQIKWVNRAEKSNTGSKDDADTQAKRRSSSISAPVIEDLVSVAGDGKVLMWSLRKGFSVTSLMLLHKSPGQVARRHTVY